MSKRKSKAANLSEHKRDYDRLLSIVSSVLREEAVPRWMQTPIPALDNLTPSDLIGTGRLKELLAHCERYLDTSFS